MKKKYLSLTECLELYQKRKHNNIYWNGTKTTLYGIIVAKSILQHEPKKKNKGSRKSGGFSEY